LIFAQASMMRAGARCEQTEQMERRRPLTGQSTRIRAEWQGKLGRVLENRRQMDVPAPRFVQVNDLVTRRAERL